jgi:hypothetical protein
MDIKFNLNDYEKYIDSQTGSILFHKLGTKGLPDKVIHGDGYTIEIKNNEIYLIDIFNPVKLVELLVEESER